ncbi:hypothetical protein E2C01_076731 [Portunus trituberculatus]|uniref:Uncharacterized protein n=1 Tax=Portunus trituberculatus TaxID=210409 RepID=A0A5B7IJR7_PORTR|nr:hypothetical protein [Portunus trituberculatus]
MLISAEIGMRPLFVASEIKVSWSESVMKEEGGEQEEEEEKEEEKEEEGVEEDGMGVTEKKKKEQREYRDKERSAVLRVVRPKAKMKGTSKHKQTISMRMKLIRKRRDKILSGKKSSGSISRLT